MRFISWLVIGLIAGVLAKLVMPGEDPGGFLATIFISMLGAFRRTHRRGLRRHGGNGYKHLVYLGGCLGGCLGGARFAGPFPVGIPDVG